MSRIVLYCLWRCRIRCLFASNILECNGKIQSSIDWNLHQAIYYVTSLKRRILNKIVFTLFCPEGINRGKTKLITSLQMREPKPFTDPSAQGIKSRPTISYLWHNLCCSLREAIKAKLELNLSCSKRNLKY